MLRLGGSLVSLLSRRGGGRDGQGAAEEVVAWANRAVEAGSYDPALCILAGETRPYYSSEVDDLLSAVLDSLRLPEPANQEELLDAEVLVVCDALNRNELQPNEALATVSQVIIDSYWSRRYGMWVDLVEDASVMAYGDAPFLVPGLTHDNLGAHIVRASQATLRDMARPSWLAAYLVLDRVDLRADTSAT